MVKNLTVRGDITPSGTQTQVGGIAGTNAGTIDNCAFSGIVMGGDYVGGIAGKNETGGTISLCQTSGVVRGTRFTGGIAGQNAGTVLNCTNKAAVNTAVSEEDLSSGLEDVESTIYTLLKREDVKENAVTTDTGGVAGYSNGILQSCTNLGAVGYPHVGYNVGGIAGRQNGYMASCVNRGKVQGRKDVGGIVGQMAPDITLQFSSNGLEELQTELNGLHNLIDATLDDAQSASDTVSGRITRISGYADAARDSAHNMTGQLGDFVDSNVDTANAGASGHFSSAMNALADAMGTLREINAQMGPVFDQLDKVLANAQQASTYLTSAFTRLAQWAQELSGENPGFFTGLGDGFGDSSDSLNTALTGISNELTALNGEMSSATTALLSDVRAINNLSMVAIADYTQLGGAVAGEITGDYSGNCFVSDTLAGVDRISYADKAEQITYDALCQREDTPQQFRSLILRFLSDGKTVKSQTFTYGASFSSDIYPDLPEREDSYVHWDNQNLTGLRFDTDVTAVYEPYVTTLASTQQRDDQPVLLVQGKFREGDALRVSQGSTSLTENVVESWAVTIPKDGQETHNVRWRITDKGKCYTVYQETDSGARKLDSAVDGSYLCFTVDGSATVTVVSAQRMTWWIWAAGGGTLLLAAGAVLLLRRRVARKKRTPAGE